MKYMHVQLFLTLLFDLHGGLLIASDELNLRMDILLEWNQKVFSEEFEAVFSKPSGPVAALKRPVPVAVDQDIIDALLNLTDSNVSINYKNIFTSQATYRVNINRNKTLEGLIVQNQQTETTEDDTNPDSVRQNACKRKRTK